MSHNKTRNPGRLIGWNALYASLAIVFGLGCLAFSIWLGLLSSDAADLVAMPIVVGIGSGLVVCSGLSHVAVFRDRIKIVNLFSVTEVGRQQVAQVELTSGMQVRLVSGRRLPVWPYSASVLAQVTGNRRAKRFGRRVIEFLDLDDQQNEWNQDTATTHVRRTTPIVTLALATLCLLLAVVIRATQ